MSPVAANVRGGDPTESDPSRAGAGWEWVVRVVNGIAWDWLVDGVEGKNAREDLGREFSDEREVVPSCSHGARYHVQRRELVVNRATGGRKLLSTSLR